MTGPEIVWEDPPEPAVAGRSTPKWEAFVAQLREHPGKWAVARAGVRQNQYGTTQKRLKQLGAEATGRADSDGLYTLYARWPEDVS